MFKLLRSAEGSLAGPVLAAAVALVAWMPAGSAGAETAENLAQAYFYADSQTARNQTRAQLEQLSGSDNGATFVLGATQFFGAVETLGQSFHRHGFQTGGGMMIPMMRLPLPVNTAPEPLDYAKYRAILEQVYAEFAAAEKTLGAVKPGDPFGVGLALFDARVNLTGQEGIPQEASLRSLLHAIGSRPGRARNNQQSRELTPEQQAATMTFRFDNADAIWLQGYANFMMANINLWLAHDFERSFNATFHIFFPNAGLPMAVHLIPSPEDARRNMFLSEWRVADFISFIHLLDWPVIEPDRRAGIRDHLLKMVQLSRANWRAIQAETDNDREWLPGPQQPGIHPLAGREVTAEIVTAWHDTLVMTEDILEGRLLVPHFRFPGQGINMKRFFTEGQRFDLVLMITGPGALPYLEKGNVVTGAQWNELTGRFGRRGFTPIAIWFN